MTEPPGIGEAMMKLLARAIEGSETLCRVIAVATLSVAETLFGLLQSGLVHDTERVKESLIRKMEAEADEKTADAQRKLAEAAEAANHATLLKGRTAREVAERKAKAEAAKIEADAEAARMDAGTRRMQAIAEGQAKLLDAISKLRQEGGDVFLSKENLESILRLPPVDSKPQEDETE